MRIAKIKEENKPVYDVKIDDFDPEHDKGSFDANRFNEAGRKLSVPQGQFTLTMGGETYRCEMLIATHFSIIEGGARKLHL